MCDNSDYILFVVSLEVTPVV